MLKNTIKTTKSYSLDDLNRIDIALKKPMIVFLCGDLWSGKTTLSQHILWNILGIKNEICSPTYTYYNKYDDHYHFDLYRLSHYDEFFAIWWEEILDNNAWIILIEWPEIIQKYYSPDITISLEKDPQEENVRNISITYHT